MTREAGTDQFSEPDERTDDIGINVELVRLPPGSLITVHGMARIFGKSPHTIMRAVTEGRLPNPFRIFSENCWRAGEVDVFLQQCMQDAQQGTGKRPRKARPSTSPSNSKPLKNGASPIRLEPHAGNN